MHAVSTWLRVSSASGVNLFGTVSMMFYLVYWRFAKSKISGGDFSHQQQIKKPANLYGHGL